MPHPPRRPIAFPADEPGDDAFLAHVERVLAAREAAGAPADQRGAVRRPTRGGTWVEVRRRGPGDRPDLAVALADLSADGVGVRLSAPLLPGEDVDVAVTPPTGGPPVRAVAQVVWCEMLPDWTFRAGLRLSAPLGGGDLSDLTL